MSRQRIYIVDAFAKGPFSGNPAAVCVYEEKSKFTDEQLQLIAAEMNLSETCFAYPLLEQGQGVYSLRWFTPTNEVPLCGHGTLATSHVLLYEQKVDVTTLTFHTQKGELVVRKGPNQDLIMDFPQGAPEVVQCPAELQQAISAAIALPEGVQVEEMWMCNSTRKLTVIVDQAEAIPQLQPDKSALLALKFPDGWNVWGIIVATDATAEYDFVSRYFAPWNGIPEDPVTGSAHTALAVLFGKRLNKTKMRGFQQSRRGGEVGVELVANGRVLLFGRALTMLEGNIMNF